MRPLASSAYQSVCAFRSALPSASKYDRTTVLVSEAGAVAWLVVMVLLRFGAAGYRTRRSRDVQARERGTERASRDGRPLVQTGISISPSAVVHRTAHRTIRNPPERTTWSALGQAGLR